jgi:hypothetical protein
VDEYRVRRNLLEQESVFRIDGGALVRSMGGREVERIALAALRRVRLFFQPAGGGERWVCALEGPSGRVWLPSVSYLGFARTADQRPGFRGFVEALHRALAAEPGVAKISFIRGNSGSAFLALVFVVVLSVMGVLLVLGAVGALVGGLGVGGASWALLPMMVVLFALNMTWPIWRKNRQRTYAPTAVPADFAPVR